LAANSCRGGETDGGLLGGICQFQTVSQSVRDACGEMSSSVLTNDPRGRTRYSAGIIRLCSTSCSHVEYLISFHGKLHPPDEIEKECIASSFPTLTMY